MLSESCEEVMEHARLQGSEAGDERTNAVTIVRTCSYDKWRELSSSGLVDPLMLIFVEMSTSSLIDTVPIKQRPAVLWSIYSQDHLWAKATERQHMDENMVSRAVAEETPTPLSPLPSVLWSYIGSAVSFSVASPLFGSSS
jgi:hypothetical protein